MKATNLKKWIFIIIGGFISSIFSFTILYYILIPDLCYYHFHEMNYIMSLFFTAYPGSNGHPEPNLLNFIVSFLVGSYFGFKIFKKFRKQ